MFALPRESRVFAAVQPAAQWGWHETFLNKIVYLLETIVWQNATPNKKAERARHMTIKPTLFRPPWMPQHEDDSIKKDTVGRDVETIKELLARPRK